MTDTLYRAAAVSRKRGGRTEQVLEFVTEPTHKSFIDLQRCVPPKHRFVCACNRYALPISNSTSVREEDISIAVTDIMHPGGQGDCAGISHVRASSVETHYSLKLKTSCSNLVKQVRVGCKVVVTRSFSFHNAPPYVNHHSLQELTPSHNQCRNLKVWVLWNAQTMGARCCGYRRCSTAVGHRN